MKNAIGKMLFKDRKDPMYGKSLWSDFEVHSITSNGDHYTGLNTFGQEFHCYTKYWEYQAYPAPREKSILPKAGENCLMNFYDRSGDNWEEVEILFVGETLFVYKKDGLESSAYVEGNEFRVLGSK